MPAKFVLSRLQLATNRSSERTTLRMKSDERIKVKFVSYAQNFEDVILWRTLKHIYEGFYIDVGAQDPLSTPSVLDFMSAVGGESTLNQIRPMQKPSSGRALTK